MGDFVEAAGVSGVIVQVQILTTVMKTADNKQIVVPNSQIMGSIITNYSANDTRRVDMTVGVSYEDDLDKVRKTLEELVAADGRILDEPACTDCRIRTRRQQRQFCRSSMGKNRRLLGRHV